MRSTKTTRTATPTPLGPDSLTWKYFGDLRTGMLGVWIGSLQNMYPQLGAGVEEHSILLREPLQRVARSVYPIMGVVYDGERARQTGEQIKGFHKGIKGVDSAGRRYHALDPETFYWAHATFFMLILKVAEYFCGGLTEAEKRQLFDEHVQWYAMYGMSMRPVPETWEEFCEYWDRVCRDELEINKATLEIFDIRIPKPKFVLMPTPVWDQLFKPMVAGQRWIAAGPVRLRRCGSGPGCAGRPATRWRCGCSARPSSWRSGRCPTRSGCTRGRCRPIGGPPDRSRPTLHWSRHPVSWHPLKTVAACRCTMSLDTRASSNVRGRWSTRRSHLPVCGPPEDVPPPPEPENP